MPRTRPDLFGPKGVSIDRKSPWRGDIRAARPQSEGAPAPLGRPVTVIEQLKQATPPQHPLTYTNACFPLCQYDLRHLPLTN